MMHTAHKTGFYPAYVDLLQRALRGVEEVNARTGHSVRIVRGGASLSLDMSGNRLPVPGVRRVFVRSVAAEVAWQALGTRDVGFVRKYTSMWDKFVEADGVTVEAAYGYRWRNHFGRDQLGLAVETMYYDPSNRQVVVCAWDPSSDALGSAVRKNVPCPVLFQLTSLPDATSPHIRHVCMFVLLRSSDVFVGLPYDVMGYALLQRAIVSQLRRKESTKEGGTRLSWMPGELVFNLHHPHIYDSHYQMAEEALASAHVVDEPLMPSDWTLDDIAGDPDGYVAAVKWLSTLAETPKFNPRPEVIE
jgi:thymidylate synthase